MFYYYLFSIQQLPCIIEVLAQVVPIRREDYYYGTDDDEGNILIDQNNAEEENNDSQNPFLMRPSNIRRKTFGSKLLRDHHNNLVFRTIV